MRGAACTPCLPSHGGTPKRLTDCVWEGMPGVICVLVEEKKKLVRLVCFGNFVNSRLIKGWILLHWPNKGMLWIKGYLSVWVLQWTVMRVWIQGARPPQIQLSVAHARQFRGRWRCAHWQRVWQMQNGLWLGLEDVCKKCLVHRHLVVLGYEFMLTRDKME